MRKQSVSIEINNDNTLKLHSRTKFSGWLCHGLITEFVYCIYKAMHRHNKLGWGAGGGEGIIHMFTGHEKIHSKDV